MSLRSVKGTVEERKRVNNHRNRRERYFGCTSLTQETHWLPEGEHFSPASVSVTPPCRHVGALSSVTLIPPIDREGGVSYLVRDASRLERELTDVGALVSVT